MIDLDHNATTKPSPAVVRAVVESLETTWHNPSSVHRAGQQARAKVELARQSLARLIGARPREIVLTSSGTESIDLAIRGVMEASPRRRLLTTKVEHAAVRDVAEDLSRKGASVEWIPIDGNGVVRMDALEAMLTAETGLVSVQWANNETGAIQPMEQIAALCRSRGVLLHCDATQWVGKEPTDVGSVSGRGMGAHLLTCSPHKFYGPKGVGVLWVAPGVRLTPRVLGSQELGRRGGTENVPGIVGAGVAADEAMSFLEDAKARQRLRSMRDAFEARVLATVPGSRVNGGGAPRLWNTTNIAFPRLEAEALLLLMSERGVAASAGAACSSGSLDPSPVLLAMGVAPEEAHGSIRLSLGRETTVKELEAAADVIAACVRQLGSTLLTRPGPTTGS